jgi:hypothetical protein
MNLMLQDFQQFWRENSDVWEERFQYKEAAPHLILQAFLQRIFNGGGDVRREMATGKNRLDLCIGYKNKKYPIELKIKRGEKSVEKNVEQIAGYMDTLGCTDGKYFRLLRRLENMKNFNRIRLIIYKSRRLTMRKYNPDKPFASVE